MNLRAAAILPQPRSLSEYSTRPRRVAPARLVCGVARLARRRGYALHLAPCIRILAERNAAHVEYSDRLRTMYRMRQLREMMILAPGGAIREILAQREFAAGGRQLAPWPLRPIGES